MTSRRYMVCLLLETYHNSKLFAIMVSFAIMVPLNMLFAIMVGSYHNRKFAIMVFAIMVGSYHNRKFAIMVFAIMVWNHVG